MKKSNLLFYLLISLCFVSCKTEKSVSNEVWLKGKLVNWGNASKVLSAQNLEADFGLGKDIIIKTNQDNEFDIRFELNEPTYYSLGRNKLYLSPGDELELEVDYKDPEAAVFNGTNAAWQVYLAGVAFPKSGSYLEGGRNLKSADVAETVALAQSKTEERKQQLQALQTSSEFKALEEMRLKLDYLNTLLSMPVYGSFKDYWEYSEVKKAEILAQIKDELNEMSQGLMKNEYMKHPNFRDMLHELVAANLKEVGIFTHLEFTPFMAEYDEMGAFVTQLELNGLTNEMQVQAKEFLAADHALDYKEMVNAKLKEYTALKAGEPAFDVLFKNALGEEKPLSDFKGQLTYVDLWATWCGPCIAELPAFEQLKEDYKDKPVHFVPVSIDTDLEAWQKYLEKHDLPKDKEYVINRLDLSDYKVITIPRYLLLDKDFNIITVFATVPSDPETRKIIDQYLEISE
ncbi:TlpA disulfide reductase family protein [uncultured Roseivirga sp.]|uniref:TlpA family protein disulfide reductase n=1 Tax=uncultured Roseivirga sp. TaxID=543088 RepID=UPI000D7B01E5|nr:TlpA disulfide reductase family protein [uncultured Roseivirga sp.]PWL32247.1 MAG: hypothetical protein DCO95_03450 [Roseivirga sp. XM-24bin3]